MIELMSMQLRRFGFRLIMERENSNEECFYVSFRLFFSIDIYDLVSGRVFQSEDKREMVAEAVIIVPETLVGSLRTDAAIFGFFLPKEGKVVDAAVLYFDSVSQWMREKYMVKTSPLAFVAVSAYCSVSSLYSSGDILHPVLLDLPDGFVGKIIIEVTHHHDVGVGFDSIDGVDALAQVRGSKETVWLGGRLSSRTAWGMDHEDMERTVGIVRCRHAPAYI